MRLIISTISLLAVTYAIPVIISEERISAILEKLRRAHAIGEFAVNTPTGIYPIKDINRDNLRQIFNFPQASTKDEEANLEDHKAVSDMNLDEPSTVEKDHSGVAATIKNKESKDKPSMDSKKAKATKTAKVKPAEEDKTETSRATGSKLANAGKMKPSKTTEAPLVQAEKKKSTEITEAPATDTEKVQTTKAAEMSSVPEVESEVTEKSVTEAEKDSTGAIAASSNATVRDKTSPLDAIDERTLNATETAEIALEDTTAKDGNSTTYETSTGAEVSENHDKDAEAINEVVEATVNETHGANAVADSSSGDSSEAAVVKEVREDIVPDKRMAHKPNDLASSQSSDARVPAHVSKHDEMEGSGELHDEVKESSGSPDDSPMPAVDSTMLLTGNGSEPLDESLDALVSAGNVVIAKSSPHSLPTITIPQNPEEPYVFVPVQSFKGQQLPGVSYLLIPKKYENKVSDYLSIKTR